MVRGDAGPMPVHFRRHAVLSCSRRKKEISARDTGVSSWRPEGRTPVPQDAVREARIKKGLDDAQFNLQQASADWRFWVAILATISVATALAGHAPSGQGDYAI